MKLAVCRSPYVDELFYGYIRSLALANGIERMQDMERLFLSNGDNDVHVHIQYPTGLVKLCDTLQNKTFISLRRAMAMTTYYSEVYDLPEGQQARLAETILHSEAPCVPKMPAREKAQIHICPECWQEDEKKYGEGYLHLSHHLPSVKVCRKHKRPLVHTLCLETKRHIMLPLSPDRGCVYEVSSLRAAVQQAEESLQKFLDGQYILRDVLCPVCNKRYLEHPYSKRTRAGCPYCNQGKSATLIINRRLRSRYEKAYVADFDFSSVHDAVITHQPCGSRKKNLMALLYDSERECMECKKLTPKNLRRRFDPDERNWIFYVNSEADRKRKRIHVLHKVCNQESYVFMTQFSSREGGYCPICDNPQKRIDIGEVDPDYKILGEYHNNRNAIQIQHKTCGTVFRTSKTSFLAGTRCPVCVPRYDFDTILDAVSSCCPDGYEIKKDSKRGYLSVRCPNGLLISHLSYQTVMLDLKAEQASIFRDRLHRYVDDRSIRKKIYDNIAEQTRIKGYWTFADGLDGEKVSRIRRNLIQDMERQGFIKRVSRGRYSVQIQEELL